jgi:hypothetical protein
MEPLGSEHLRRLPYETSLYLYESHAALRKQSLILLALVH